MVRLHPLQSRASNCGGAHPTSPLGADARFAYPVHARRVSGLSRCCIMKPSLAVECGGWGLGALAHRPVSLTLGRAAVWPRSALPPCAHPLLVVHSLAPSVSLAPSSPVRAHHRLHTVSLPLSVSAVPSASAFHRTRRPCLPLVALVLHTLPSHLSVRNYPARFPGPPHGPKWLV